MEHNGCVHLQVKTPAITISGISDTGRMRSENQDAIYLDEAGKFMLLADGMGGHERGAEASQTTLTVMKEYFHPDVVSAELGDITEGSGVPAEVVCLMSLVDEAVNKANTVLYERNQKEKLQRFMGTTVVGLIFTEEGSALWFHVGDSRLYRWRGGDLKCLTKDHSAYAEWVRKGREGAEPGKNVVTRAIGPNPGVIAETLYEKWEPDDTYFMCSDGLTDLLSDELIADIIKGGEDVDSIALQLIDGANDAGGKDNVSVVVCRV
jgi:PPM family protein phosphatase